MLLFSQLMPSHKFLFLLLSLLMSVALSAQERIGTAIDNYTPANGMLLNPSVIADQRPWLDIHLVGVGFYLRSNTMFNENSVLSSPTTIGPRGFLTDKKDNWIQVDALLMLPSVTLSLGKNAFGFHVAARAVANAKKLPVELLRTVAGEEVSDRVVGTRTTRNGRIKGNAWAEVGFSYARVIYSFNRDLITFGGTLKRYSGIGYGAFTVRKAELQVFDTASAFTSAEGIGAFAPPAFNAGGGWGISVGFTYKKMLGDVTHYTPHGRAERCVTIPYRYKLSVGLADIGYIRYRKGAQISRYDEAADADDLINNLQFTGFTNTDDLGFEDKSFTTTAPMALTAQFDYNYSQGLFFNALFVQRIARAAGLWTERANLLAVTPRFERKIFSLGLPISLVNYSAPQLGAFFRVAGLTIGTENLTSYIIRKDMYAADFYFHFRILFNRSRKCKVSNNSAGDGFRFRDLFKWHNPTIEACPEW